MKHIHRVLSVLCLVAIVGAQASDKPQLLELWNETVCYVNNQRIAKRDVEQNIDPMVMARLEDYRRRMIAADNWNETTQRQYHELLLPDFRRELRNLVRQKLMLQEAKEKQLEIDKVGFQKRLDRRIQDLRQYGVLGKPGFTIPEIKDAIHEQMLVQEMASSLVTALDLPNKPQIEKYFKDHQAQYMLPPMVKLRIIKVHLTRKDSMGNTVDVESPLNVAEDLRKDVVDYGINFADLAREKSDDEETRPRGGLLQGPDGSPFIDPDQNRILGPVVKRLNTGSVTERTSQVFRMDEGWAFVFLEERRAAGPAPLDTDLYEKIRDTLIQEIVKRKEKEWFVKALQRSLVLDGSPNPKPIPIGFFFPEDPTIGQQAAAKDNKKSSQKQ